MFLKAPPNNFGFHHHWTPKRQLLWVGSLFVDMVCETGLRCIKQNDHSAEGRWQLHHLNIRIVRSSQYNIMQSQDFIIRLRDYEAKHDTQRCDNLEDTPILLWFWSVTVNMWSTGGRRCDDLVWSALWSTSVIQQCDTTVWSTSVIHQDDTPVWYTGWSTGIRCVIRQCDDVRGQVKGGGPSCELVLKCTSQRQPPLRHKHTVHSSHFSVSNKQVINTETKTKTQAKTKASCELKLKCNCQNTRTHCMYF